MRKRYAVLAWITGNIWIGKSVILGNTWRPRWPHIYELSSSRDLPPALTPRSPINRLIAWSLAVRRPDCPKRSLNPTPKTFYGYQLNRMCAVSIWRAPLQSPGSRQRDKSISVKLPFATTLLTGKSWTRKPWTPQKTFFCAVHHSKKSQFALLR